MLWWSWPGTSSGSGSSCPEIWSARCRATMPPFSQIHMRSASMPSTQMSWPAAGEWKPGSGTLSGWVGGWVQVCPGQPGKVLAAAEGEAWAWFSMLWGCEFTGKTAVCYCASGAVPAHHDAPEAGRSRTAPSPRTPMCCPHPTLCCTHQAGS